VSSDGVREATVEDLQHQKVFTKKFKYVVSRLKKNPDQVFGRTQEEIADTRKATNRKLFGADFPLQTEEKRHKARDTLIKKYGVDNYAKTEEYRDKFRKTHMERYGVEHPMHSPRIRQLAIDNSKARYDGVHHTRHPNVVARTSATNMARYGANTPFGSEEIRSKANKSLYSKWGVTNPQMSPEVREKTKQTRISLGLTKVVGGMTMSEKAAEIGSAYSYVQRLVLRLGEEKSLPFIDAYSPGGSSLTRFTHDLFSGFGPVIDRKLPGTKFRPDLCFEDQKVVVEADGLYWHSDGSTNDTWNPHRTYHTNKLRAYETLGYRALFFRSDEIQHKPEIVKSIVHNALGANEHRVFARKCSIEEIDPVFFDMFHLMGKGSGRAYGLVYENKVVAGIQVRWVRKKDNLLDVSRFSTASATSVPGGWSRLIKHVQRVERPSKIQTFIDRRYGTGKHLAAQGWTKVTEGPSFRWTDGIRSVHRMKFKGNSGYDNGFFKIWDCGQAKWELSVD